MNVFIAHAAADPGNTLSWLDIALGVTIPLLAAVIPVLVAGYLSRRNDRRDNLRNVFSEALRAVADYQELPYLIRRRSNLAPMTREELMRHASDVQSRLDFHIARLELESQVLGDAYRRLVAATRQEAGAHMTEAWRTPRIAADDDVPLGAAYERATANQERGRCLGIMRAHLGESTK